MEYVQMHNNTGSVPPVCDYFCSVLRLWELRHLKDFHMPFRVKNAICLMVLASVGSHQQGSNRPRKIQLIEGLGGPLITDAFVGVCCNPLKKLCQRVKRHLIDSKASTKFKDIAYDGWVRSQYHRFPYNDAICAKIVGPDWNPPVNVVERWVEICMSEMWRQTQGSKVVCLKTLCLETGPKALEQLKAYVDNAHWVIPKMVTAREALPHLGLVDMIILPVRMAGAWILYITQRSTKQQGSYRISANFKRLSRENRDVPYAAYNLD